MSGPRNVPERQCKTAQTGKAWWYDDKGGVDVLARVTDTNEVTYVRLLWSELRKVAKRRGEKL